MKDKLKELKMVIGKFMMDVKEIKLAEDGGELMIEGEVAVGTKVYVYNEAGEIVAAPDGEFVLADGVEIVVEGGEIKEVKEVEVEEVEELTEETSEEMSAIRTELENQKKMIEAIYNTFQEFASQSIDKSVEKEKKEVKSEKPKGAERFFVKK